MLLKKIEFYQTAVYFKNWGWIEQLLLSWIKITIEKEFNTDYKNCCFVGIRNRELSYRRVEEYTLTPKK